MQFDFGEGALSFYKPVYIESAESDDRIAVLGRDSSTIIARFNLDGTLDRSFGWQGYIRELFSVGDAIYGFDLIARPDGRLLVCGSGSSPIQGNSALWIAQYNHHGSADQQFNGGQPVQDYIQPVRGAVGRALTIAQDGKVIVVGNWYDAPLSSHFLMARYLSDGSARDSAFGDDGKLVVNWAGQSRGVDVVVQADGTLLVLAATPTGAQVFKIMA